MTLQELQLAIRAYRATITTKKQAEELRSLLLNEAVFAERKAKAFNVKRSKEIEDEIRHLLGKADKEIKDIHDQSKKTEEEIRYLLAKKEIEEQLANELDNLRDKL